MTTKSGGELRIVKRTLVAVCDYLVQVVAPVLAPVFAWVARTGTGSKACLRLGFLPMPVHYYSPVPDIRDLELRKVWERQSELGGIDFRPQSQLTLLAEWARKYGDECNWPSQPTPDPNQFYTENNSFSFGCAASTHLVLRQFMPKRVIEIGSGNSSLVISGALHLNRKDGRNTEGEHIIVDPYPRPRIEDGLPGPVHLMRQRVETLEPVFFDALAENDVLFVDSGHTVRTGGDVNFLFLDVLPRLAPGVIVHIHDIGFPSEYPKVYFTNPRFRVFWTEAYLLQAFLCFNREFEVLLAMAQLMSQHMDAFQAAFAHFDPQTHLTRSGSFWMRRRVPDGAAQG